MKTNNVVDDVKNTQYNGSTLIVYTLCFIRKITIPLYLSLFAHRRVTTRDRLANYLRDFGRGCHKLGGNKQKECSVHECFVIREVVVYTVKIVLSMIIIQVLSKLLDLPEQ